MRTGVMTSGASLSEISSRFVFHVGKVLLWKVEKGGYSLVLHIKQCLL